MKKLLAILITGLTLASCGEDKPIKDEIKGNTYTCNTIGWTMEIPEGWTILEEDSVEVAVEDGLALIDKAYDGEMNLDVSAAKNLLDMKKDDFNSFGSTLEPFEIEHEWEQNNNLLKEIMYETFVYSNIKVDTSSFKEEIDGLKFDVFHVIVYDSKGDILIYQDMYSKYINGFDLGVSITYKNDDDKQAIMNTWKNSTFKR